MTVVIKDKGKVNERVKEFDEQRLISFINRGLEDLEVPTESKEFFVEKVIGKISYKDKIEAKDINRILIQDSLSLVDDIKNDTGNAVSYTHLTLPTKRIV